MNKDLDLFVESLDRTEGYMSLREKAGFWDFMINLLNNRSLPSVGAGGTSQQTKLGKKGKGAKNLINLLKQHQEFVEDFVKAKIITPIDDSKLKELEAELVKANETDDSYSINNLLSQTVLSDEQIKALLGGENGKDITDEPDSGSEEEDTSTRGDTSVVGSKKNKTVQAGSDTTASKSTKKETKTDSAQSDLSSEDKSAGEDGLVEVNGNDVPDKSALNSKEKK